LRCRPHPAGAPPGRPGPRRPGAGRLPLRRAPGRLPRPRGRPQAGLGLRLAVADGRRAHRHHRPEAVARGGPLLRPGTGRRPAADGLHDRRVRDRHRHRLAVLRQPRADHPSPLGPGPGLTRSGPVAQERTTVRQVGMQVTAKAEYALRAATVLATSGPGPVKSDAIAAAEDIPLRFLHNILAALTRAGILSSLRGADGGYELTRSPQAITVA